MSTVTLQRTQTKARVFCWNRRKMPLVGFGLWKVPNETCADTVYNAIKMGYRLFDGACDYGNEKEAGEGVRRAIADGLVKREELFITSKLWNTFHAHDHVKQLAKKQLQDWGLDYFDLYLVHFPIAIQYVAPEHRYPPTWWDDEGKLLPPVNVPMQETWSAMEELADEGLAHNIGVSNVCGGLLLDMFRYARIPPQVLQVELHPYNSQAALIKVAQLLGVVVTGYSQFGPMGYREIGADKNTGLLFDHPVIQKVAQAHGKTPAQVLLRWLTQRNITVMPKATRNDLLQENLRSDDFQLTDEDFKQIATLNINRR
ncbi:NADP-dependent oxidoreductase domain-containing protein, partial [Schizophyllum commune]